MSSTTKKVIIDPESKRIADELLTTDDMFRELADYERQIKTEDDRKKVRLARQMYEMGDELVEEVKVKEEENKIKRIEMVEQIYDLSGDNFVTLKQANEMTIEELQPILFQAQELGKPWYVKFLNFLMGM